MGIKSEILEIFDNKINFLLVCGSYLQNKDIEHIDIDIFCCVDSFNKRQERMFREAYFSFHKKKDASPDICFPGELMTLNELEKSIKLTSAHKPKFKIKNKKVYDGLVWAGMIVDNKKIIFGKIPEEILSLAYSCIRKWNKKLFNRTTISTKRLCKEIIYDDEIFLRAKIILDKLIRNKEAITKILLEVESYETVEDEFFRSIDCLKNIEIEKRFINLSKVRYISAFFPVNLPLYSLIIFGFIPSLMAEKVFIKAPEVIALTIKKIKNILFEYDDTIYISKADRKTFIKAFVKHSDVILFTGRYQNVKEFEKKFFNKLIIYNGAGINPIIVNRNANINLACKKVIKARIFNSGQDCAGPDAILVHTDIYKKFVNLLKRELKKVKVGNYKNKQVRVGRLLKPFYIDELEELFKKEEILFGGFIQKDKKIIYPTIISKPLNEYGNYKEFFSPIFWVSEFRTEEELKSYFETKKYREFAMRVSIFGDIPKFKIPKSIILKNKIVMDIERGNLSYGGYGKKAQFVSYKGVRKIRPILISKEILQWKKIKHQK